MNFKKGITCFLVCLVGILFSQQGIAQTSANMMGFFGNHAEKQQQLEKEFDTYIHTQDLDRWMKRLAAKPHHVGSPYGKANALFLDSLFTNWGYETKIDTYYVLFPTPKIRKLELVAPTKYEAGLMEKVIPGDPYTAQTDEQLPPYNIYSADGDVTADLVYVNYGLPRDYKKLDEMGVSVKGKIVIAKYGRSWRGVKPKVAYEHGAIGCILYSDPRNDGYYRGDVYPKGPWKNAYAVQRGSVLNAGVRPGDPLTPGYAATKDAKRLPLDGTKTIKKIPVLPIGYGDAKPLLAALDGPLVPKSWRGGLPITYHVGPGPAKVHLKLAFNWDITPIYNVIATMKGSEYPDQWILRGNHHDAWVNGASDPVSGLISVLAEAQAISHLAKQGWQPKRTLKFCAWDGEEAMLLGSTEFAEDYAKELKEKAVVYINSDNISRGTFRANGASTLKKFISEVAFSVNDPEKGVSLGSRRSKNGRTIRYGMLGSGSDYTPFFQHLGIASLSLSMRGGGSGGEYHTNYDDYIMYKRFKDPGFKYVATFAKAAGRAVLRFADADVLPFDFGHLNNRLHSYTRSVKRLDKQRKFDFVPLDQALNSFKNSVKNYKIAKRDETDMDKSALKKINGMIYKYIRHLTSPEGLPGQAWYKNLIFAPGIYTGYGAKSLPGIRQSIQLHRDKDVEPEIKKLSNAIMDCSKYIDQLSKVVKVH